MVLIYISLIIGHVEHLFIYMLAISLCFLEKCLFSVLCLFFNWTLFFEMLSCMSTLYILSCVFWILPKYSDLALCQIYDL